MHRPGITADDIARYERDGAVLLKGVLDREALGWLETGLEEAYRSPGTRYSKISSASGEGETMVEQYVTERNETLHRLMASGIVGEIGATIMQTPTAQLILDQIFYKTRGPIVPTPWHQDTPFLRVRGQQLVRIWMPCDYSPAALTVQVVRGSHRWNVVYNSGGENANDTATVAGKASDGAIGDSWLPFAPDVARYRDSFDILHWDVEPGDALVFQGNMLHGADGHPSHDSARRALAVLMGGPELRYHAPQGKAFPTPRQVAGLTIPDGAPIGDYPEAFPVYWRSERAPAAA